MKKNDPVAGIMTTEVVGVHDGETVSKLRAIFESHPIHHIPVVSGDELIGIVSWNDFMRISFGEFGNQDAKGLDEVLDHTYTSHDVMNKASPHLPSAAPFATPLAFSVHTNFTRCPSSTARS